MLFAIGKDVLYALILSRIQVQIGMIPVTLLSPLSPFKKGANALYIGILSPCHPFLKKS